LETLLQVTPPKFKLTCINRGETNRRDSGLHGKVMLVPNSSYLFSAGTQYFSILKKKYLNKIQTNKLGTKLKQINIYGY